MLKKIFYKFSLITLMSINSFFSPLEGHISEIEQIQSIENYLKNDTLVLLNVGDTLFSPSSMLSDYQWREYLVERVNLLVSNPEKAQSIIDSVKSVIVEKIPKICPEKVTPSFIAKLQEEKIPVLGYTQRFISTTYAENNGQITSNHLLALGIDLSKTLEYYPIHEYRLKEHAFQYGMIFTNKNPIGSSITAFLMTVNCLPRHVIIVDDSIEALENAENALTNVGVEVQGLRYSRIDTRKNSFDRNLATLEFFTYLDKNQIISDDEALLIKEANPEIEYEALLDEWILNQAQVNVQS